CSGAVERASSTREAATAWRAGTKASFISGARCAPCRDAMSGERRARPLTRLARRQRLQQWRNDVHWQREDDRRILVGGDDRQRLQVAQLNRQRRLREHLRSFEELLRRLQFAFGVNHLRAPLAFG